MKLCLRRKEQKKKSKHTTLYSFSSVRDAPAQEKTKRRQIQLSEKRLAESVSCASNLIQTIRLSAGNQSEGRTVDRKD